MWGVYEALKHVQDSVSILTMYFDLNLALEKNNNDAQRNYRSSNKSGKEILLTDPQQELLINYERDVRKYIKSNTTYWDTDIYDNQLHYTCGLYIIIVQYFQVDLSYTLSYSFD